MARSATYTPREQVLKQLDESGGKHLVFVRYGPHHDFHYGVVFNDADIESAPVVWAHDIDPASYWALAKHFRDRTAWLFNPDHSPVTLVPFTDQPYISAVVAGAGRRRRHAAGSESGRHRHSAGRQLRPRPSRRDQSSSAGSLPLRLQSASANDGNIFGAAVSAPAEGSRAHRMSVRFGAVEAPILAVSNIEGQEAITVQVPYEVPTGPTEVTLRLSDFTARKRVAVLPATPGIFQMQMDDGHVRGIVVRTDGSIVDLQHPAHRAALCACISRVWSTVPTLPSNRIGAAGLTAQPVL